MSDPLEFENEIIKAVEGEAFGGPALLADQRPESTASASAKTGTIVSRLMLIVAGVETGKPALWSRIKPVAVALELLELAVRRHYPIQNERTGALPLITGDYYYARAITLVAALRDGGIVKALADAIADIAVSEASFAGGCAAVGKEDSQAELGRRAALFTTAVRLGARFREEQGDALPESALDDLVEYGRALGLLHELQTGSVPAAAVPTAAAAALHRRAVELATALGERVGAAQRLVELADAQVTVGMVGG